MQSRSPATRRRAAPPRGRRQACNPTASSTAITVSPGCLVVRAPTGPEDSGDVSGAELFEGDRAPWVVGVGDPAEPPVAVVVVEVGLPVGRRAPGEQTVGEVPLCGALCRVLECESAVVLGLDDAVVVGAQQLSVADAGDPATGTGF